MEFILQSFFTILRESGVRISVGESIVAMNAIKLIGYSDRESFKHTLSTCLIKTIEEKEIFEKSFELFFSAHMFESQLDDYNEYSSDEIKEELSEISKNILDGDKAGLMTIVRKALQNVDFRDLKRITQQGLYIRKVMDQKGIRDLEQDIGMLAEYNFPGAGRMTMLLEKTKRELVEYIDSYVSQQYNLHNDFNDRVNEETRIRDTTFSKIDQKKASDMSRVIQILAKQLYALHSRRRKNYKRGTLDIRKTLRKNSSYQGYIFVPQYKYKKIQRPEIFVICDISNSVQNMSRFMLLFVYSLNKTLLKVRSFALCSNLTEVSHVFKHNSGEIAIDKIHRGEDIDISMGPTDYGQAFKDFKEQYLSTVKSTSTVIILGDARNNEGDPKSKLLKEIQDQCKTLIWLNPEVETMWGAGDSVMDEYRKYCDIAQECNSINHLHKTLDLILRS
ncbi:VWA domain-containing protein [Serpentinicella alkaliphila]|uniref:VWA domain containing CoxE-like protein n=1 Tax=Serpentinicella alkaliphila TaxID=1734049 RepID=A0A4R2T0R2_9FIRM|nr:VWA domain-containing protein [Serpentinicella alkaliphila]QUH26549.1 VWA domain-containing protein [Serpentinicella alkaliphila]TCP96449.1 hypothetical protein EDD79_10515 [Serpentinicella alkaliphila]